MFGCLSQVRIRSLMRRNVLIALGSNVTSLSSSPEQLLSESMDEISKSVGKIYFRSKNYRTPCFPAGAGPDFANAVIRVETELDIPGILEALHRIEADFGRVRTVRWGQRTLDLDLLAADDVVCPDEATLNQWINLSLDRQMAETPDQLLLPHPRLQDRAFVLVPMADVAPDWKHPILAKTVLEMLEQLPRDEIDQVVPIS
ncbi:2-amino-4-hydroxy-6-hydroxymethyldihydropteridine diphosphokinase [Donghicola sp. JL3646]|nr:2-amino-4-hydroxy-6-hydroxymethyldihydropteridine diphosphokinase [Marivivens sp. JLT3646]OBR38274.1 2-amino-4-hydroxy-6-hydroxymethyldihydropteridine diphosphokinase [Donghicola sp. JL3646]